MAMCSGLMRERDIGTLTKHTHRERGKQVNRIETAADGFKDLKEMFKKVEYSHDLDELEKSLIEFKGLVNAMIIFLHEPSEVEPEGPPYKGSLGL